MQTGAGSARMGKQSRALTLVMLFCAELAALGVLYQFFANIECQSVEAGGACAFLRSLVARGMVVLATTVILVWAWPATFHDLAESSEAPRDTRPARALHLVGLVLMVLPLVLAGGGDLGAHFGLAIWPWAIGSLAAAAGGLLWLAPAGAWGRLLSRDRFALVPILALAFFLPDLANAARPLWDWTVLTSVTFAAVEFLLRLFSDEVYADAAAFLIGVNSPMGGFVAHVGAPCSGVEGFALVTAFVGIYAYVFRDDLHLRRYWLVVLPIGLALSWILNVVRITVLMLIGARVSPDLAVNGFHSYAGWLFFTLLATLIVGAVQITPWLHRAGMAPRSEIALRSDPVAAAILPFIAFMVVSIATSALLVAPDLGYPVKAIVLALALAVFLPVLRGLDWSPDWRPVAAGAAVGLAWIGFAGSGDPSLDLQLAALPAPLLALWILFRLVGTVVLVPVVEELFFRGYLLMRLDGPGPWRRVLAILISSAAFGALHGRFIAGGLAGIVFALAMLHRGRVTDAILAHAVANLLVALAALWIGDWSLI